MTSDRRRLRSGYTTGACAAAAAKAAVTLLLDPAANQDGILDVEIPFPGGERVRFTARGLGITEGYSGPAATSMVIKDGGDDPDVTHGAAIVATAEFSPSGEDISIEGGEGVGRVTKPGLSVPVGEPAITPVPRSMITEAVKEALAAHGLSAAKRSVRITISVPEGKALARKTLNARLGIMGGISILGTTGIVQPLSAEAWTATIAASLDVAAAAGIPEVVLSSGRVSEKAHIEKYNFPEEAYVMMGDYVAFSLGKAAGHGFRRVHISAQWAKMLKMSMAVPETHVRHGAIDPAKAAVHLKRLGLSIPEGRTFNTAREIYEALALKPGFPFPGLMTVCRGVKRYSEGMTAGIPVTVHLVSYQGEITGDSE